MHRREQPNPLPPRVQAALNYLYYCSHHTSQSETSIPARSLTTQETSVHRSALRVLSLYFDGEMDFGDAPPTRGTRDEDDDSGATSPAPVA
ncbi:MAG: hypothetical protein SFY96_10850 [Planctomycetota bacterium]|nr:hypothetical protein [Planctomycetota bacterium]